MRAFTGAAALLAAVLPAVVLAMPPANADDESPPTAAKEPSTEGPSPSFFTLLWQLDRELRSVQAPVTFHRTNYIMVFSYNGRPNEEPWQALVPPQELKSAEATFQLSFKAQVWQDVLGTASDLWIAYTQRSFWQVYDYEESSPFRETDYEPEILLNLRTRFDVLGLRGRFIQIGLNHQSNGQTEPLSRSWNRVVANVGLERGHVSLLVKTWYRLPEGSKEDDNPDISDYLGYGEIWGYYCRSRHRAAIMLRDNLDFDANRGAIQLEWSFPLFRPDWPTPTRVGGYLQWFYGYGESLLDYDHLVNRIGAGFTFAEWY